MHSSLNLSTVMASELQKRQINSMLDILITKTTNKVYASSWVSTAMSTISLKHNWRSSIFREDTMLKIDCKIMEKGISATGTTI